MLAADRRLCCTASDSHTLLVQKLCITIPCEEQEDKSMGLLEYSKPVLNKLAIRKNTVILNVIFDS